MPQTEVDEMDAEEAQPNPSLELLQRMDDLATRITNLADDHPTLSVPIAAIANSLGEARGFLMGDGPPDAAMRTLTHMLLNGTDSLITQLEVIEAPPASNKPTRELLADLLELAPDDDHGEYPNGAIDDLRNRARVLLING